MSVHNEPQDLQAINDAWKAPVSAKTDPSFMELDDLGLMDEHLDDIKGGPVVGGDDGGGGRRGGDWIFNHNETTMSDEGEEAEAATLDDLPVAADQADLTKGGMLSSGRVRVSTSSGY